MKTPPESRPDRPAGLPEYPDSDTNYADFAKAAYAVQLKRATSRKDEIATQVALLDQTDVALVREFHESVRDVAKTALEHADALPQLVITAAGAVVTLYTGVLALVFAAANHPLPARGLIPALFLGLAIASAVGYAGYITRSHATDFKPDDHVWTNAIAYTNGFVDWINSAIEARAWLMRAAVLFLALGVAFLPSAFIDFTTAGQGQAGSTPGAPSVAALAAWPTIGSSDPSVTADLQKILYQAQVDEVATERAAAAKQAAEPVSVKGPLGGSMSDELLLGLAVVLGLLAIGAARWPLRGSKPPTA